MWSTACHALPCPSHLPPHLLLLLLPDELVQLPLVLLQRLVDVSGMPPHSPRVEPRELTPH